MARYPCGFKVFRVELFFATVLPMTTKRAALLAACLWSVASSGSASPDERQEMLARAARDEPRHQLAAALLARDRLFDVGSLAICHGRAPRVGSEATYD